MKSLSRSQKPRIWPLVQRSTKNPGCPWCSLLPDMTREASKPAVVWHQTSHGLSKSRRILKWAHHSNVFFALKNLFWLAISVWFWRWRTNVNLTTDGESDFDSWHQQEGSPQIVRLRSAEHGPCDLGWFLLWPCADRKRKCILQSPLFHESNWSFVRVDGWTGVSLFDLFWLGPSRVPHLLLPWPDLLVCRLLPDTLETLCQLFVA